MSFPHFDPDADETAQLVSGSSGVVQSFVVHNEDEADVVYLQLFDAAPTVGTTTPRQSIPCPPGVSGYFFGDVGLQIARTTTAALYYAVTATPTGAGAPPSNVVLNLQYR